MNIDTLYENFYKRKESSGLIDEVMKFLLTERDTSHPKSETFTYDMIPTIPISELGWGALKTPEGGGKEVPVDPDSRSALSQYLSNIGGGGDIKAKLQELNGFFAGDVQPTAGGPPAEQLRKTISYLIFYKTLTQIVTNFNASSAGFSFESFLAVLLDAETGKQIPASGAGEDTTIADIVLFQGSRPISVKLYKEGSLKVGGSYRQLIKDLTAEGAPPMEYVAVTKDVSGDGPKATGKLRFYSFNFTLKNVVALLALATKNRELLRIPAVFADAEARTQIKKEGGLEAYLELPEKKFVDTKPLVSKFYKEVLVAAQEKGLSRTALGALKDGLEVVMDLETGQPTVEYDQRPFFGGFPKSMLLRAVGIVKGSGGPMDTVEISKAERNIAKEAIGELWTAATLTYKTERKGGGARSAALERLAYMNEKDSIDTLLALSAGDEAEIYRLALKFKFLHSGWSSGS